MLLVLLLMTNTNTHLLNIFDSFKTNNPHFYPYLTSGRVLQGLWLRGWNPSPSNVLLHVGSHVRNIALWHRPKVLELNYPKCDLPSS